MKIRAISVHAADEIVDRFRGGFVQRFHRETCGICSLFVRHLQTECGFTGVAKLAFVFSDLIDGPPEKFADLNVTWPFLFVEYAPASDSSKREQIAAALREALLWCAPHVGWQPEQVESAYGKCLRDGLVDEQYSRKTWRSPDRRFRVRLWYRMDLDSLTLQAVLIPSRGDRELARRTIAIVLPSGFPGLYVDRAEWTSETCFTVTSEAFPPQQWTIDFADIVLQG